jgi:hypothetical protein
MRLGIALTLLSFSLAATAAEPVTADEANVDAVQIDFDAVNVDGKRVVTKLKLVDGPPRSPKFKPLITVRTQFEQEMKRSVAEVR